VATKRGGIDVPVSASWNGRALKQAERQLGGFQKSVNKSFAGLGASIGGALAIGAIATGLRDMASAAAEDQKSVVALSKAMSNMGLGKQNAEAEAFVRTLMLQTGVLDDQLRPALQTLVTATGSMTTAQSGLSLAMDISAATGRSLEETTKALARGYSGSAVGLSRLGVGLDKTLLASGDMVKITDELRRKFGGQAAAAADTYAGRLARVSAAADEAKETIGYALLKALDDVSDDIGGTGGAIDMMTQLGDRIARNVDLLGGMADALTGAVPPGGGGGEAWWQTALGWMGQTGPEMIGNFSDAVTQLAFDLGFVEKPIDRTGTGFERIAAGAVIAQQKMEPLPDTFTAIYNTSKNATGAIDQLRASLDLLNGKDRSARESRIGFGDAVRDARQVGREVIQGKPKKVKKVNKDGSVSWSTVLDGKGNTVMTPDRVVKRMPKLNSSGNLALGTKLGAEASSALDAIASAAEDLSVARANNGNFDGAIRAIEQGRAAVRRQAKSYGLTNFSQYMPQGSPLLDQLSANDSRTRVANALARDGGTTIVIERVEVSAETPAQVVEQVKQYVRLQSLGAGRGAGQVPTTPRGRK
jgi:hypothetical protein